MRVVFVEQPVYEAAVNDSMGWCVKCEDFTRGETEPDAHGYNCPACGGRHSVVGAEDALLEGLIDFADAE